MKQLPLFLISFFAVLYTEISFAQEITVKDEISQQSIPGAKVYSIVPKVQLLTDANGRFQLDHFIGCDTIYIRYSSYDIGVFTYDELRSVVNVALKDKTLSVTEMTVSANRWEQDKIEIPGKINKIDLKEAELLSPQTSADLLESGGYVFVQKSQLAGGSPQLRGFGTNRVMIVVDGVRMNNAIFRSGNLQNVISLDANSLESAEVLFGPGAVIYGSDAIGGVMNFRTKMAKYSPDSLGVLTRTNLFTRYSSSSNEITTHGDFNLGLKKWAFLTSITHGKYGDLRAGKHGSEQLLRPTFQNRVNGVDSTFVNDDPRLQVHSGYSQLNAIQKISFKPTDELEFNYGFNYSTTSDAPRYDRLIQDSNGDGILDLAEWYYGPQQWMMHNLGVMHSDSNTLYDQLRFTGAYQKYKESRHDRKRGQSQIRRQFEEVDAFSLNIDAEKEIGSRINLYYGIEGVFNKIGSTAYREDIETLERTTINSRYPNGSTWQAYGAYLNGKYSLDESWKLTAGLRYSYYQIQADFDTSSFSFPVTTTKNESGALNGSLGLVYHPQENLQIYINTSTGFRAPNIDDLGKVFDSEPGSVIVPNVELRPEYAYNAEIGFVKAWKSKFKLDGAIFYTYLEDALARTNFTFNGSDSIVYEGELSRVQAIQNIANANVYGIQGGLEWVLAKGLSLKSTISYQRGNEYNLDSNASFPKSHVAPLFGRTSLSYKTKQMRIEAYSVYHGKVSHENLPLNDRNDHVYALDENGNAFTASWYTLNVKGAYYFNKHLSATVGVENITNQLYRTAGSGISASGLNVVVSVKASFF